MSTATILRYKSPLLERTVQQRLGNECFLDRDGTRFHKIVEFMRDGPDRFRIYIYISHIFFLLYIPILFYIFYMFVYFLSFHIFPYTSRFSIYFYIFHVFIFIYHNFQYVSVFFCILYVSLCFYNIHISEFGEKGSYTGKALQEARES